MPRDQPNTFEREMSFLDHLEELRSRIVKAILAIILAGIGTAFFSDFLVKKILMGPLTKVGLKAQVLTPYGIVMMYMETVLIAAIIIAMPVLLYQLWQFIAPGLMPNERKYAFWIVTFTSICFLSGIVFAYFVIIPFSLNFFATFGTDTFELNIAVDQYISFILTLLLGAGIVFELPMISYFLSKLGILNPALMRKYRRHAIVVILIISAVVTPTPDVITQSMLAAPMILLYEISIFISKYAQRTTTDSE